MRPPPAIFTREKPCTKVELHNCFYVDGQYKPKQVYEAQAIIGLNSVKYLIREGYVIQRTIAGKDYYCPTADGDNWLRNGILRYLSIHPDRARECRQLPPGFALKTKKVKRLGYKELPKPPPAVKVIRRRKV